MLRHGRAMRRRQILAVLPFVLGAGAARAAGAEGKKADDHFVDLAPVALPIAVGGKLINYVFCSLRVNFSPSADAAVMRSKEPWFRDAIVRAGHRTPFTVATDYTRIDEARLKAVLLREARVIVGARNIASVVLTRQEPKQRSRLPRPPAPTR